MAMLTNNVREWEPRWRSMLPVDEIFELVVDSAFVGMRKPDAEIYELTLERLGDPEPGECLFIDDIEANVEAARELGISAVHYRSNEQAIAEIREVADLDGGPRNRAASCRCRPGPRCRARSPRARAPSGGGARATRARCRARAPR